MTHSLARWASIASAVALSSVLFAWSAPHASAQSVRVAVMPFEGAGGAGIRRQVQSALGDDSRVSTVDLDRVDTAGSSPRDVASELEARLVIAGDLNGRGRRREVELIAYDANGREVARVEVRTTPRRSLERGVSQLLDAAIPQLPEPRREVEEAPPPPRGGGGGREEEEEEEEEEDERGGGGGSDGEYGAQPLLFSIAVGLVPRTREADVTLSDSTHRRYNSGFYPEFYARAEIRPGAQSGDMLRGLFGNVDFAHSLGLTSRNDMTGDQVDTSFFRVGFNVGFLVPIGSVLEIGGSFGAGWDVYNLATNTVLPSVEYIYLRPAARLRVRIIEEVFALDVDAGFRPVISRGDLGPAFSESGGGDTFGLDVGATLGGAFDFGLFYGVGFAFVGYYGGYADPAGPFGDGDSVADSGVRLTLMAGWAFR